MGDPTLLDGGGDCEVGGRCRERRLEGESGGGGDLDGAVRRVSAWSHGKLDGSVSYGDQRQHTL